MKRFLVGLLLSLAAVSAVHAQSNATPSLHVALNPCQVFSGSLAANTTTSIDVRGLCNVPDEATAVEVAVIVSSSSAGTLKIWEFDGTEPSASVVSYVNGTESSLAVPRLCAPLAECFHDVSLKSTTAVTTVTLVAEGYFLPPE
jgi:hypothetical protein